MPVQNQSLYLLTEDLGEKVAVLRHLGLETPNPDSQYIEDLQSELAHALQCAIGPDSLVVRRKMRDVATEVLDKIHAIYGEDVGVVSTCPEIAVHPGVVSVEINRLVDRYGDPIGLGPRPGYNDLESQFKDIAAKSKDGEKRTPIVIAEDGVFKGETMTYVVEGLREAGAEVIGIVAGFCYKYAYVDALEKDLGVEVDVANELDPILDWVPDHDFLPFTPGCGKVLGVKVGQHALPQYGEEQVTFCMPYISPYSPVEEWATIPQGQVDVFSNHCRALSYDLFGQMEKLNPDRTPLRVCDVMHSKQQVSIPISLETKGLEIGTDLPDAQTQIKTALTRDVVKV